MKVFYNHLHFRSADPDAAAKFYCDNFGAEITSERPLSTTKSINLSLDGDPLMTISGRAEGEDRVAGSTEPPLRPGPLRLRDRRHSSTIRPSQGQRRDVQLRALDHAVGLDRSVRCCARRGERGVDTAAVVTGAAARHSL